MSEVIVHNENFIRFQTGFNSRKGQFYIFVVLYYSARSLVKLNSNDYYKATRHKVMTVIVDILNVVGLHLTCKINYATRQNLYYIYRINLKNEKK